MKISEKFKPVLAAFAMIAIGVGGTLLIPAGDVSSKGVRCPNGSWYEDGSSIQDCVIANNGEEGKSATFGQNQEGDLMQVLNTIINVVIGVIGFIAVVMIIIGGVQYTISAGDTGKVTKAKNTIMYGVIGLVIALLAFAIVNFVLANVFGSSASSSDD